jgi:hypothetical protein
MALSTIHITPWLVIAGCVLHLIAAVLELRG